MRRAAVVAVLLGGLLLSWIRPSAAQSPPAGAACPPVASLPTAEARRAAAPSARDRGLLWRIERDGRTSYLYGTLHLGRADWLAPGPRVREALQASEVLALEIDLSDPRATALPPAALRPAELPPRLRERVQRQAARDCLPPEAVARLPAVMQGVVLSLTAMRRDGLDGAFGQELALAAAARDAGLDVVSLETAAQQMAALLPASAAEAETLLDRALAQLESGRARPLMQRLVAAWERGDLDELAGYERWCECADDPVERAFYRRLNDGRNAALAERIDALHAAGRRVFAGVGALHMTGAQALPLLLVGKGYRVERVR